MARFIRPIDVFYCEELFVSDMAPRILARLIAAGAAGVRVSQRVLETLSDRELSQGLVATFAIDSLLHALDDLDHGGARQPRLVVVLDRLQYPGNAGTLIRTADAVGADAVILIEPAVDTFAPQAIRATMGSIFAIPIVRITQIDALDRWGKGENLQWLGADVAADTAVWESSAMRGSIGLILGNEGEGLQPDLRRILDSTVRLPQRGGAESLNVSVAGGILMYEWMRVNYPDIA
jgi:TrmH family RNA methyltransferase